MKTFFVCVAFCAAMVYGQALKTNPGDVVSPSVLPPVTDRPLSEVEVLKLQVTTLRIKELAEQYKLPEYQKELAPINSEQIAIVQKACESVGVPKERMQQECGLVTGFDQDGKPLTGQDGKPVATHVWHQAPPPAPVVPQAATGAGGPNVANAKGDVTINHGTPDKK